MTDLSTPAELDDEAKVTASDRSLAARFWAAFGTPVLRALLAATGLKR